MTAKLQHDTICCAEAKVLSRSCFPTANSTKQPRNANRVRSGLQLSRFPRRPTLSPFSSSIEWSTTKTSWTLNRLPSVGKSFKTHFSFSWLNFRQVRPSASSPTAPKRRWTCHRRSSLSRTPPNCLQKFQGGISIRLKNLLSHARNADSAWRSKLPAQVLQDSIRQSFCYRKFRFIRQLKSSEICRQFTVSDWPHPSLNLLLLQSRMWNRSFCQNALRAENVFSLSLKSWRQSQETFEKGRNISVRFTEGRLWRTELNRSPVDFQFPKIFAKMFGSFWRPTTKKMSSHSNWRIRLEEGNLNFWFSFVRISWLRAKCHNLTRTDI